MFEDLVSSLLSTYLGDYLEGLTKSDLKISLWKGDVELRNLRVKTEALDFLNIPIQVKDGFVGKLTLKIPWKNLGKKPTKVFLDDVYVVTCPKSELNFDEAKRVLKERDYKRAQLKAFEENRQQIEEELNVKENTSSTAKLVAKIIDNLQLRINRIHLRYEDHFSCAGRPFCAGVILEKLYVTSLNDGDPSETSTPVPGIIDKRVKLHKLGIYWDCQQSICVDTSTVETLFDGMIAPFSSTVPLTPQHYLLQPISLELNLHLDMRRVDLRRPGMEEAVSFVCSQLEWSADELRTLQRCYLHTQSDETQGRSCEEVWCLVRERLLQKHGLMFASKEALKRAQMFCERCWEVSNTASPMIVIDGEMDRFVLSIDKEQYCDIMEFVNSLSVQAIKARYRHLRPEEIDPIAAPREWWQFAIKAVICSNQQTRKHGGWKDYLRFKKLRSEYIALYKKKNDLKQTTKKDTQVQMRLESLEDSLTLGNILLFRKIALNELNEEAKKKKKSLFSRKSRKTLESSHSPVSDSENDSKWNETRRNELLSQSDFSLDEESPWEGGQPKDIQIRVDFRLRTVGLDLMNGASKLIVCKLKESSIRFFKRKEFVQFWFCVEDVHIEDKKNRKSPWRHIIYTEKETSFDNHPIVQFVPSDMVRKHGIPFLQVAIDSPSLDQNVDFEIHISSLPMGFVAALPCLMDVASFFVSNLNGSQGHSFHWSGDTSQRLLSPSFLASFESTFSPFHSTSRGKDRGLRNIAREIATHKRIKLDVNVGALSVLLPANVNEDITHTQVVVIRLGDVSIHSNPSSMDKDAELTEETVYDTFLLTVHDIRLLLTHYHENWQSADVQTRFNLSLLHDLDVSAAIGISKAPSEPRFASVRVVLSLSLINISLTQIQYIELIRWMRDITDTAVALMNQHQIDFLHLSTAMVTHFLPDHSSTTDTSEEQGMKQSLCEFSEEEKTRLQHNRRFQFQFLFKGVTLTLIETDPSGASSPFLEAVVNDLELSLLRRSFDWTMDCVLSAISVKDCLRSSLLGEDAFMVRSENSEETAPQLIRVSVSAIKRDSPEYASSSSDVSLRLELGSLNLFVFRPTVSHLINFILSDLKPPIAPDESNQPSESPLSSDIPSEPLIVYLYRQVKWLFHHPKSKIEWLRRDLQLTMTLQSASIHLLTDQGVCLIIAGIHRIHTELGICPALIEVSGSLGDLQITDCSDDCGLHSSILSITEASTTSSFIQFKVSYYRKRHYPQYPGYRLSFISTILSPCLTLRRRILEEIVKYFVIGSLADCFGLLYTLMKNRKRIVSTKKRTKSISMLASAMEMGKSLITEGEKDCTLPIILPFIHITVTNFVVQIPESTTSKSLSVFELGQITVSNHEPSLLETDINQQILSSLNTVTLTLQRMCAYTVQSGLAPQALLGNIAIESTMRLSHQLDMNIHISKLSITVNEHQFSLFLRTLNGNLHERSLCEEDLKQIQSLLTQHQSTKISTPRTLTIRNDIALSMDLDGLLMEFLKESGGYSHLLTGNDLLDAGKQPTSLGYLDITSLHGILLMKKDEMSGGLSLSSVSIHDSRHQTSIHPIFTVPFLFGGVTKPALTVLLKLQMKEAATYPELLEASIPSNTCIRDVRVSVRIGNLRIVPTPWIFQVWTQIQSCMKALGQDLPSFHHSEKKPLLTPSESSHSVCHLLLDVRVDNPSVFLVEDTSRESSPSFVITFSADASITVSPLQNLDVTLSVSGLRGCRGSIAQKDIPPPSMMDAINPLDMNMNLHCSHQMKHITGTLTLERISVCVSMKDILLITNAIRNLIPISLLPTKKAAIHLDENRQMSSQMNNTPLNNVNETPPGTKIMRTLKSISSLPYWLRGLRFPWILNLFAGVNEISVVIVNDTLDSEVPIAHGLLREIVLTVGMTEELMKMDGQFGMEVEYYDSKKIVWEPIIEPWVIHAVLEMEPRERILQRLSGDPSSFTDVQNAITRLYVESTQPLNLNLTASFLSSLFHSIHDFKHCSSSERSWDSHSFIGLRNCLGIEAFYCVEDDGGVNHLEKENECKLNEEQLDEEIVGGLGIVQSSQGEGMYWIEIHSLQPHIRVYDSIPFVRNSRNPRYSSQEFEFKEGSEGLLFPVCSFFDAFQNQVTILVESQSQSILWTEYLKKGLNTPLIIDPLSMENDWGFQLLPATGEVIPTPLPAHPSLSLIYLHQPYRKLAPRTITIQFNQMPSFLLDVDRFQSVGVELKGPERELQIMIETSVERGMKVFTLSAPMKITNSTNRPLLCSYGEDSSSSLSLVQPNHSVWGSEQIEGGFILGSQRRFIDKNRIENELATGVVNMGNEYVMVREQVYSLPLLSHPHHTLRCYHLLLSDILMVENLLPEALEFRIITPEERVIVENIVKPGTSQRITTCRFSKKEGLRVSLRLVTRSFDFCSYDESISPTVSQPHGACLLVNKETGEQVRLHYEFAHLEQGTWNLQLYCKYWIMNKTGDDLIVADARDPSYCFLASGYPVDVKTENEAVWNYETLLQPILFSVGEDGKKEEAKVMLQGDCVWSQDFSINTQGMRGECIIRGGSKGERERCYAVAISRAPGIFAHSLVVTLTPFYIIVNELSQLTRLRQQDTLENLVLQPHSSTPFHWTSLSSPRSLQLLIDSYSWSSPFPLVPGHYSLALPSPMIYAMMDSMTDPMMGSRTGPKTGPKTDPVIDTATGPTMDPTKKSSHLYIPPPDPAKHPQSVIQIDVMAVEAQYLVFLRQISPEFISLCISNDTLTETLTICQNGAMFDSAVSLPPLTSRMMAFSFIQSDPSFLVFSRNVGTFSTPTSYVPVFLASLSRPGHLGEFTVSTHPGVDVVVSVDVLMHHNTHILVFKSDSSHQQDLQRHWLLMQRNSLLEELHQTENSLAKYMSTHSASSSPQTAFLDFQFIQSSCCTFNQHIHYRFEAMAGESQVGGCETEGVLGVVMERMIVCSDSIVKVHITLMRNEIEQVGEGVLDLKEYSSLNNLMEICVPCLDDQGRWLCELRVIVMKTVYAEVTSKSYHLLTLQQQHDEIESVLDRCSYEWRNTPRQQKENESHILRAIGSGQYQIQSQAAWMNESHSSDYHFSVILHSLKRLPMSLQTGTGLYALVSVGNTMLRTPLCSEVSPDSDIQDIPSVRLQWRHIDSDCLLIEQGKSLIVSQIIHNSLAYVEGLRVGHRLVGVNDEQPPSSLEALISLLNRDSSEKVLKFAFPPDSSFIQYSFHQKLVFPAGITSNVSTFSVSVYEEEELLEDRLLFTQSFPISNEEDSEMSMLMSNESCLCLETSWECPCLEQDVMIISLQTEFRGIGVSLMDKKPQELMYLSMTEIGCIFALTEHGQTICSLNIQSLQIDNQCVESSFPVLLSCPSSDWFSLTVVLRAHPSVVYVEEVDLRLQDCSVNVESNLLSLFIELIRSLPWDESSPTQREWLHFLQHDRRFVQSLIIPTMPLSTSSLYASFFRLQNLVITLTCKMDPTRPISSFLFFSPCIPSLQAWMNTMITVFGNTDNASLQLDGLLLRNVFLSPHDLLQRLQNHYTRQILSQLYKILGSVTILGNPMGLLDSVGSGVKAFFIEPAQGFVNGPMEFIDGIGKGTKALVMNTAYGVCNSVSNITGTLGNGLSSLTMNEEYQVQRAAGKSGLLYGVKEGVTGIVKDTMKGARMDGLLGALKGTGKGLAGLMLKPVTGVLDDTTRLIEGVKSVTQLKKIADRIRPPRFIYPDGVITPFCQHLAEGQQILHQCKTLSPFEVKDQYLIHLFDNQQNILLLTQRGTSLITPSLSIIWTLPYNEILRMDHEFNIIHFFRQDMEYSVIVASQDIAYHLCIAIDLIRSDRLLETVPVIKQIASLYGEHMNEEDYEWNDRIKEQIDHYSSDESSSPILNPHTPVDIEGLNPDSAVIERWHQNSELRRSGRHAYTFDVFEIVVTSGTMTWEVHRRYSDFILVHKCMIKERGRGVVMGLKLPPKHIDVLRNINSKLLDSRIQGLNRYLRILIKRPDLLEMNCVQNFLKSDPVSFG